MDLNLTNYADCEDIDDLIELVYEEFGPSVAAVVQSNESFSNLVYQIKEALIKENGKEACLIAAVINNRMIALR